MASKKTATKRVSHKAPKVKVLIQLSKRAKRELDKLLKRSKAGTITKGQLNAGLKDVAAPLKQMLDYVDVTLDDLSKLQKLDVKTSTTKQLNLDLQEIHRSVSRMLNHHGPYQQ